MSSFHAFAETAERIAATSRRNEKADRLAAYLATLPDDDLRRAPRWFAGRLFPLHDQRTASVGPQALLNALETVAGVDADTLRRRVVELGAVGDVAGEVLLATRATLTLADVAAFLDDLANTRGTTKKTERLTAMLRNTPPLEAKYLVKLLEKEPRIGLREGGVELAIARWTDTPIGEVQWANMLLGDLGETALFARQGRLGEARMHLFHPIKFMLATPAEDPDEAARVLPSPFAIEDKFDGIRAQAHIAPDPGEAHHGQAFGGTRVALFSRTLDAITPSFPELIAPLAGLVDHPEATLILDGEIVPVLDGIIQPFQALQKRLGRKKVSAQMQTEFPVAFIAYDLLYRDGEVLLERPFRERQALLDTLAFDGTPLRRSELAYLDDAATLDAAFEAARNRGNEGLMLKHPEAPYRPGKRGREWLKYKKALGTLDCVVTAVEVGSGRRRKLLSDYTFAVRRSADDDTLLNVGKAYSGLTDIELQEMTEWFEAHTRQQFAHGKVRLVDPEIVVEVAFDAVQPSKRHKSGFALRFPRIVRLRPDKPADEIDTLERVRQLAAGFG